MMAALLLASLLAQDSAALHRAARDAQAAFERNRRAQLPLAAWIRASGSRCEERIGRFCYWYDKDDPSPPAEPPGIAASRQGFLDHLASLARALPGDAWITGQRVRYLLEAGRGEEAQAVAGQCPGAPDFCLGLVGLARHVSGDAVGADEAFSTMLRVAPPADRCRWADLELLLDRAAAREFRRLNCEAQVAEAERLLALSDPLLALDGNAFRGEFYARQVMARLFEGTTTPHAMRFGGDQREMMLRFGWPVAWSRTWSADISRDGSVVGHDPTPAWVFLPVDSREPRWSLEVERARSRARPFAIRHMQALETAQLARFRRGTEHLLVARFDIPRDTVFNSSGLAAVLAGGRGSGYVVRREMPVEGQRGVLILRLQERPHIGGLELSAREGTVWARHREAWGAAPEGNRQVSDLLLFDPTPGVAQSLEAALDQALAGTVVRRGSNVGVFWELDGLTPTDSVEVRLTVRRAGARDPRLRWGWREPAAAQRLLARGIAVDMTRLGRGEHLLELEVTVGGESLRSTRRFLVQ